MPELTINDRLKAAQAKVKSLAASRDNILGDLRVEEQKLKQAYASLTELGIEDVEKMSAKELQALTEKLKTKLASKLEAIEEQLAKGDELMKQYQEIQES